MADLNVYDVAFGDFKTQMQLSDEDAKSYGDRASKVVSAKPGEGEKQAPAAKNKSRSAANKSS